jgi:hypothetical protein
VTAESTPVLRPPVPQQVAPVEPAARVRRAGTAAPAEPATPPPAEPAKPVAVEPAGPAPAGPSAEAPSLDDLAATLRPAISGAPGGAPDPDEVVAALEDAGITDQSARQSFGQPDLFALARRLLPRLALAPRPRRHAVAPLQLDWSGLLRPRLAPARLVAAAGLVTAVWWLRVPPVAALPAAAAVPLAELLLAWHMGYSRWGLGYHDSGTGWRRHLRRSGLLTLLALTLPLLLAAGFAGAATHLAGLVPVATGLLASGGYPLLLVLTARRRFLSGASLIAVTAAGTVLTHPSLLRMGLLAGGYLAGLALTAYAILDPRGRD